MFETFHSTMICLILKSDKSYVEKNYLAFFREIVVYLIPNNVLCSVTNFLKLKTSNSSHMFTVQNISVIWVTSLLLLISWSVFCRSNNLFLTWKLNC